ncbi:sigma-54-dependent transcriptional regulator [Alkalilimnicola ehrlichii MLHE-1]|uniref:Two component, sigma54 specific, transcriptional regulator, Fis family n=1 Tax=Alkalilimnicola ehrlichii (strain ATCC BAA-1101 / DSM 17681 / MLHE-1) TaxID=187272 RepID=Q0A5C4_ALKEH|nr:sigma-54 dependent transcriptional regulator [Alkalilimnicola ehrlichii]ABI57963.1 two component, sigma54 specific, transcriptional regulator, Fis family [Alkalilimnicola ehrlichii MLHE-1]
MSSAQILVVDDEQEIRDLVEEILKDEGYRVRTAHDGASAREAMRDPVPDLVLLDIWMPDVDGVTLLKEWTEGGGPACPVVMMSGHGTVETAVEATRLGAWDFIEKPLSMPKLLLTVERALEAARPRPPQPGVGAEPAPEPVGKSQAMRRLREDARRIAVHDTRVLLRGEAGSGKRCIARYIHEHSPRRAGPFIEVSAGGLGEGLGVADLCGLEREGETVPGALELAQGGTLYLADVCEMEPALQGHLLGVLKAGRFQRQGGARVVDLDVRLIAGTRVELADAVRAGRFREDFYYYLDVVPLVVPALREHVEDVPELLQYYVNRLVERDGLQYREFTLAAQNRLRNHSWPGNVRELENLVQRLLIMGEGEKIDVDEVEAALEEAAREGTGAGRGLSADLHLELPLREAREAFERRYLQEQLRRAQGSVGQLARLTGMERTHLYRKLKALGIDPRESA